ncbi:MAG: methyltransferase domain-containing protein [Candidatus Omnitrophica bacterium]|nr:methyltransferase domain-containing protein [Candidatus Omnitrophota bacterium]
MMGRKTKHKSQHNYLSERVVGILRAKPKGKVLDLGCGSGESSLKLAELGFQVTGADMDVGRFKYHDRLSFVPCDLKDPLNIPPGTYDYVIFLEVIEHIYNPGMVMAEISRVLKPGGRLIISTPNVSNIGSRLRFLFEGSFDFFREPLVEFSRTGREALQNVHVIPWRYNELEFLLFRHGLEVCGVFSDSNGRAFSKIAGMMLKPFLTFQAWIKERRSLRKGGADYRRMNRILLSDALLYGRHMILEAEKKV